MSGSAIDRSLVSDQVFRVLCDAIMAGTYAPGEKLPTQRRLASELGVNLAPVREAIKRLEQLRLLEVRQGDAMRVRNWRAHGALDVLGHVIFGSGEPHLPTLSAVMEARQAMLGEVACLAAERRTEVQAEALARIAHELAAAETAEAAQMLDFAFFSEMVEAAHNIVFVLVMNTLRDVYIDRAELFRGVVDEYRAVAPRYARAAAAIAVHDTAAAALEVRELAALQAAGLEAALR
jgi:GntR family transcriptional regulator, transcriptional repressor for pyruvate dehydrogenase complex